MAPNPWIYAGLASSFPNIEPPSADASADKKSKTSLRSAAISTSNDSETDLASPTPPPCKILQCSARDSHTATHITPDEAQSQIGFLPQILVFRYRDKFHAMDHACPHRTYPLSRGSLYDIEDFGIVLSAGITCPGHGWSFDLFTGEGDKGTYRLGLWDVELRDGDDDEEVWVRKRERKRIG